jgi:hypothetical protein
MLPLYTGHRENTMQTNQVTVPSQVTARVRSAAKTATKKLSRDYSIDANHDDLQAYGMTIVEEQAALTEGKHPVTPEALASLRIILIDMMIEYATAE